MIHVAKFDNPFKPTDGEHYQVEAGVNVWELFASIGLVSFDCELLLTIDNRRLSEDEWDNPIPDGSVIGICPKVEGGIVTLIVIAVVAVAALVLSLTYSVDTPEDPNTGTPDPMYSLKGQTNQVRFGEPIECAYGRTRIWCSHAAKSYNKNISNDAWLYSLYCLGQGHTDLEDLSEAEQGERISIEDTPINDFEDVEWQVVSPGESVTLFRDNVQTTAEVGGLELYGPNQTDEFEVYERVVNDAGTTTNLIELDLTLPRGLYNQDKKGRLRSYTVAALFRYVEIDDLGNEIGTWQDLKTWSKTLATTSPRRFTISAPVPYGRYKVSAERTNNYSTSHKVGNTLLWDAGRAYLPSVADYGDVTLLAVKMRATSNLNDQSKRKINVVCTRKLPWNGASIGAVPTTTRSLVAAFIDVFISKYGAALTASVLDMTSLAELDAQLESEGVYFDWVFDSSSTVWDAAKTIARACRGVPILGGSQVYIVRDKPRTQLQQLFNAENIVEGSFQYNIKLPKYEDTDAVEVEYTDPITWKRETVLCALPGDLAAKPQQITLAGVTDRDRAYHEGMHLRSSQVYQKEEVAFSTGVEGLNVTYGDYIRVVYDALGLKGAVSGFVEGISTDRLSVFLSAKPTFAGGTHKISITGKDGTPYTYVATAGTAPNEVVLSTPLDANVVITMNVEPPRFAFGQENLLAKDCVVTSLYPAADDTVDVTAIVYRAEVYAYDGTDAPPIESKNTQPKDPSLPVVTGVSMIQVSDTIYKIEWEPAVGATSYIVQMSGDPNEYDANPLEAWETVTTTGATSTEVAVLTNQVYIRVAGINTGQGPWAYYDQLIEGDVRITEATATADGDIRVTHDGDTRITHNEEL
jgi:predicted phage tail protein